MASARRLHSSMVSQTFKISHSVQSVLQVCQTSLHQFDAEAFAMMAAAVAGVLARQTHEGVQNYMVVNHLEQRKFSGWAEGDAALHGVN
jgi:hypothetical protein